MVRRKDCGLGLCGGSDVPEVRGSAAASLLGRLRHRDGRLLSPSLHIYNMQSNAVMSIAHRMSGVALYVILVFLLWVMSFYLFSGAESTVVGSLVRIARSGLGKCALTVCGMMFAFHAINGIRYLLMDVFVGRLFGGALFRRNSSFVSAVVIMAAVFLSGGVVAFGLFS